MKLMGYDFGKTEGVLRGTPAAKEIRFRQWLFVFGKIEDQVFSIVKGIDYFGERHF
jgi:hypothetical protein